MKLTGPQTGATAGIVLPGGRREASAAAAHGALDMATARQATPTANVAPELLTYGPAAPQSVAAVGGFRGAHVDVRA